MRQIHTCIYFCLLERSMQMIPDSWIGSVASKSLASLYNGNKKEINKY